MLEGTSPIAHAELSAIFASAQCSLVGIWTAMGGGKWWKRLMIGAGGVVAIFVLEQTPYVIVLLTYGGGLLDQILLLRMPVAVTTWLTAAGGLALAKMRQRDFELVWVKEPAAQASNIQFSIRSMLVAMFATAIVLTFVRLLRDSF